jgi:hypothetical protein
MSLSIRPCTIRSALAWVGETHRRLPRLQGGMWAVQVLDDGERIGVAIVGHPARLLAERGHLCVLRVAVTEGHPNACSILYGACARAARAMGAADLVTYTHLDELGTSLRASGWIDAGLTSGGEHDRPSRRRLPAIDALPKRRWVVPWGETARSVKGWR